jgi:SAM-dependent methyltransferase
MRPKEFLAALRSPRYLASLWRYRGLAATAGAPLPALRALRPITNEATAQTGFDAHYIYHTGWAARVLAETRPERHIDIGSSLYFVSIASAIVPITHYDYRPPALAMPGVAVGAADLLELPFDNGAFPSLSCMHVIEHVGLGRYGDRLDPLGDRKAAAELQRVLAPGGQFLFVTPVGRPAIAFNAHRIYSHEGVLELFPGLKLKSFALITDKRDGNLFLPDADPARVARQRYGCGCYLFEKPASA